MILGRNVEQDQTTRMTTLPFLLLALSPFFIFDSDYLLILCPVEDPLEYFYDTW